MSGRLPLRRLPSADSRGVRRLRRALERDYEAAVKQVCRFCEHFLVHGPDIDPNAPNGREKFSGRNRFIL